MTITDTQRAKAATFRRRHVEGDVLVLPNPWDHASAALIAAAGFEAMATTSVGVAAAHGMPDGQRLTREQQIAIAGAIAARTDLPVTADLEAGYGVEPAAVATTVEQAIRAGLVGCNIEDIAPGSRELMDFDLAVARIRAGADAARSAGVDFVLNGRTDPYLAGFGDAEANFAEAVRRANAFLAAGAGCVYVPGVTDAATIGRLAQAIDGPLNVHTIAGRPALSLDQFRELGVRRISLGGSLMQAVLTGLNDILAEVQAGSFAFAGKSTPSRDLARMMVPWWRRAG